MSISIDGTCRSVYLSSPKCINIYAYIYMVCGNAFSDMNDYSDWKQKKVNVKMSRSYLKKLENTHLVAYSSRCLLI